MIIHLIVTKISIEKELLNLPPKTMTSWNGLTLAHSVGCITLACPNGLTLHLTQHNGQQIDHYSIVYCCIALMLMLFSPTYECKKIDGRMNTLETNKQRLAHDASSPFCATKSKCFFTHNVFKFEKPAHKPRMLPGRLILERSLVGMSFQTNKMQNLS